MVTVKGKNFDLCEKHLCMSLHGLTGNVKVQASGNKRILKIKKNTVPSILSNIFLRRCPTLRNISVRDIPCPSMFYMELSAHSLNAVDKLVACLRDENN